MLTAGSVCSGVGGLDQGFEQAGFTVRWQAEIDKDARDVLAYHWPDATLHGDIREVGAANADPVDVLFGGTPCQSFSVAGLRRGLDDARGNLMFEFCRIADELEPRWIVWENVPGVLSDKSNAFGCLLGALVGADSPLVPPKECGGRWTDAGMVAGPKRHAAWRIVDAQYAGVAQRRRRVFVVASPRAFGPGEILLERDGVRRDHPPRRQTGQGAAGISANGPGGNDLGVDCRQGSVGDVAHTIQAKPNGGFSQNSTPHVIAAVAVRTAQTPSNGWGVNEETAYTLDGTQGQAVAGALTTRYAKGANTTLDDGALVVTHTLKAEGHDASEDGTGRGVPLIPVYQCQGGSVGEIGTLTRGNGHVTGGIPFLEAQMPAALPGWYRCPHCGELHLVGFEQPLWEVGNPCLACGRPDLVPVYDDPFAGMPEVASPLVDSGKRGWSSSVDSPNFIPACFEATGDGQGVAEDQSPTLKRLPNAVAFTEHPPTQGMGVRRLMPVETERLMGWPDGHTARGASGKEMSDSARYRMCGNGVVKPVAFWIARRIMEYENAQNR